MRGLDEPSEILELRLDPWSSNWSPGASNFEKTYFLKTSDEWEAWRPGAGIGALELNHEGVSDAYTTDMRGVGKPSRVLTLRFESWRSNVSPVAKTRRS